MGSPPRPPIAGLPQGLVRRRDERMVAGVCAGVARWLGVDPIVVRLAAAILALANGAGLLVYLLAWAVLPEEAAGTTEQATGEGAGPGTKRTSELALAVGCITLGTLLLVRWVTPFFPDQVVWPAAVAATGVGLVLARAGDSDRARWREAATRLPGNPVEAFRGGWMVWARVLVGAGLLITGIALFLASNGALAAVGNVGIAVLATVLGGALLFSPWVARLVRQLGEERRERIRNEERADMAAHLHDSVLQTLALIQRHADAPQQARSLARRQERELRAWLYDGRRSSASDAPATLATALDGVADEVEADHGVAVDVVVVGDCPVDEHVDALVAAVREAVLNAARHSGAEEVSVYAEVVGDARIEAFVRDRGRGFDPATVNGDRRGITHSIVRRMTRHGGRAHVHSAPGEGTEVTFELTPGAESP
ncbi:MAG TPA: PspC domain-containing protein [Acidimicrobiales bacterium]|nr:PspC domain-containing protein [Acidimicrobiales bacterium]